MRKGIYDFPVDQISIEDSPNFIGLHVSNSVVSFLILTIIVGIIFIPFMYPLFWKMLYGNISTILIIVGLAVGKKIITITVLHFLSYSKVDIKNRRFIILIKKFF